jgi:AraC-like DNA-binding protein
MESTLPDSYTVPTRSALNPIAAASPRVTAQELCEAVELDVQRLDDPHGRLPMSQLIALYEVAARMTKDSAFGLHVAVGTALQAFGVLGYILMNSATVGLALERLVRYLPIWTDGASFTLQREGRLVHLIWQYAATSGTESRHDCEMTLLSAVKLSQLSTLAQPSEVRFQHSSPKNVSEHRRLFRAPVYFHTPRNELIFEISALNAPMKNVDPDLCDLLIGMAEEMLAVASSKSDSVERIRLAVKQSLGMGDTRLKSVSRTVGMSARALQRKLQEHGTSLRALLSEVRQQRAEQTLRDPQISVAEIAYLLGYSHPSEFHRAFRGWTGNSPRQYRSENSFRCTRIY